jgi:hypothetical protein
MEGTLKRIATIVLALATLSAATLALADGWYLMEPPYLKDSNRIILFPNRQAPLAEWTTNSAYETASECEAGRERSIAQRKDVLDNTSSPYLTQQVKTAVTMGGIEQTCVATNDPRLGR